MSFSPAELFLLLFATIGPTKPMVILAVELMFVGLNSWGVVEITGLKAG